MKNFLNLKSVLVAALLTGGMFSCKDTLDQEVKPGQPSTSKSARPVKTLGIATAGADFFIDVNTTWSKDTIYVLQGNVRFRQPAVLTIQPGTIIKGDKASQGTLVIQRGARIVANGQVTAGVDQFNPIVFTSNEAPGSRAAGDWGGVAILGKAPNNNSVNQPLEGFSTTSAPVFGGTDNNDNSGTFRFVRIEFAGIALTPNNEKNSITLGSVGGATVFNHVQTSYANDDAFEFFGGSVDGRFLISYRTLDDDYDFDFGYTGELQNGITFRDPALADISKSNGIEADNNNVSPNYLGVLDANLKTHPILSQFSIIGPGPISGAAITDNDYNAGFHARRNSEVELHNSVITGWPTGLLVENTPTEANFLAGRLKVRRTTIVVPQNGTAALTPAAIRTAGGADLAAVTGEFNNPAYFNVIKTVGAGQNISVVTGIVGSAWAATGAFNPSATYDFSTRPGDLLNYGPGANPNAVDYTGLSAFFARRDFRGAKGEFDAGWKIQGNKAGSILWTNYNPQAAIYE